MTNQTPTPPDPSRKRATQLPQPRPLEYEDTDALIEELRLRCETCLIIFNRKPSGGTNPQDMPDYQIYWAGPPEAALGLCDIAKTLVVRSFYG